MNTDIRKRINKIKKIDLNKKIDWEIDYSEISCRLQDDNDNEVKPLLMAIVHPESYFVLASHLVSPAGDYLDEFLNKIIETLEKSEVCPGRVLVKKEELFNLLKDILKELNINLKLVKRTKSVEHYKKESEKFFRNEL